MVEGDVERVSDADADAYFVTRPRASQIGAWASKQSASLTSPASLEERVKNVRERFDGAPVPRFVVQVGNNALRQGKLAAS